MIQAPLVIDRATADLASEMIALFGGEAALQASLRANRSRDAGNAIRYCRWRQAERLIDLLADESMGSTVH